MAWKFSTLDYQNTAVASVVDLFAGTGGLAQQYIKQQDKLFGDVVVNVLPTNIATIQDNMGQIQKTNRLPTTDTANLLDFSISMETGTGKTFVYTKTIYELNNKYGFTKFIIVVPSIAIREGVQKSLDMTHDHFQNLYGKTPIRWFVYNSSKLSSVREFSQSNGIEVMIINIDAFRRSENIIHQDRDGGKIIDLIRETNPIVIIDEPQSVANTDKSKEAIASLNPLFVIRYSATHREEINVLYRLTPVDAYQQGLVKQISVSSIASQDNINQAYIKLISVDNSNGYKAKIELDIKTTSGKITRTTKTVKLNDDLFIVSGEREQYRDLQITDIDCQPGFEKIELNGASELVLGQSMNDVSERDIKRGQIRKTIEHHLDKEVRYLPKGIKVLSLFFLDRVDRYRIHEGDTSTPGEYAQMFEEEYNDLVKKDKYKSILDTLPFANDATTAHDGYFSKDKKGKLKDTRGDTADDIGTYSLIMKDKERLLDMATPLRFIFSHSALKEGWDNPNVFQVCTLLEQTSSLSARQKVGRGLRLCVNDKKERITDKNLNLLHIIATESFSEFAEKLQKEIETDTGIKFGILEIANFVDMDIPVSVAIGMGLPVSDESKQELEKWNTEKHTEPVPELELGDEPELPTFVKSEPTVKLGVDGATKLMKTFVEKKIIDSKGKPSKDAVEKVKALEPVYQPIGNQIISEIRRADTRLPIMDENKRIYAKRKEGVIDSTEFLAIWNRISQKTKYRVHMDKETFIKTAVDNLVKMPPIERAKISETTAQINIEKTGVSTQETNNRTTQLNYDLTRIPDILGMLRDDLKISKSTIYDVLTQSGRMDDILNNPEKFIEEVHRILKDTLNVMLANGIKYIKIEGEEYSAQEVFDADELQAYLENAIATDKSVYDYVVDLDSGIERTFASDLEKDEDVRFFFKLPPKFQIETPFGAYNPDWAVLLNEYGTDKLYLVVETKGTLQESKRRLEENAKIRCAGLHFGELGTIDYQTATTWKSVKPSATIQKQ